MCIPLWSVTSSLPASIALVCLQVVALWLHETCRVFADRLTCPEDHDWFRCVMYQLESFTCHMSGLALVVTGHGCWDNLVLACYLR